MGVRPLLVEEYAKIIELVAGGGFLYEVEVKGKRVTREFKPNPRVAMTLQLQATTGLRIGDVLQLKLKHFRSGKLEITESKTKKLQYRDIHSSVISKVYDYAIENDIKQDDRLFPIGVRAIQKQLKLVVDHLGLDNIGTHSFRKMYATTVYNDNNNNIELVKELLNHDSIVTTQRYIKASQQAINEVSSSINFMM